VGASVQASVARGARRQRSEVGQPGRDRGQNRKGKFGATTVLGTWAARWEQQAGEAALTAAALGQEQAQCGEDKPEEGRRPGGEQAQQGWWQKRAAWEQQEGAATEGSGGANAEGQQQQGGDRDATVKVAQGPLEVRAHTDAALGQVRTEKALSFVVVGGAFAPSTYDPPQRNWVSKPECG